MRERQWGFDCVIVLFKREGGVVSARDCYFGITVPPPPFTALLLTLFLTGWRSAIARRNIADVYCLFVIIGHDEMRFPFRGCLLMFTCRLPLQAFAFLCECLITITGVWVSCPEDECHIWDDSTQGGRRGWSTQHCLALIVCMQLFEVIKRGNYFI